MEQSVSLREILDARENRVLRQQTLLAQYHAPLICFTMNIPGPVKSSPLIEQGFRLGLSRLEAQLAGSGLSVLCREQRLTAAGWEAFWAIQAPAKLLKTLCVQIEDGEPVGRLFDLDVLTPEGYKLQRADLGLPGRRCLLCGEPAHDCGRSRRHSLSELQARTQALLSDALCQEDCRLIAHAAVKSLLFEVAVSPKPGLVDRNGSGSHRDMDLFTFLGSASSLWPYFEQCVQIGQAHASQSPEITFSHLRYPGKLAQQAMFAETGGVNTHKGAIFSLGLCCAAAGQLGPEGRAPEAVLSLCAQMAQGLVERELGQTSNTAGERLYREFGITGIRGQAEAGFPAVAHTGLPILREGLSKGLSLNDAAAATLLYLFTACQDTNLIARGDLETWHWAIRQVKALLQVSPFPSGAEIQPICRAFTEKNLSPGGSADLLSLTLFLHFLCGPQ